MKRLISLVCTMVLASASFLVAQELDWEIKKHSTEAKKLEAEINTYVNKGYVPLGLTYDKKELYILYVMLPDLGMEAWYLNWYDDTDALQEGITATMEEGFVPTGISYTGDQFFVLYIKAENSAQAWQMVPSGVTLKEVQEEIQPYIDEGYIPAAITFYDKQYWTLLIDTPGATVKSWLLETYKAGSHGAKIDARIADGYLPWGLEYSGKDRIDILYIGF